MSSKTCEISIPYSGRTVEFEVPRKNLLTILKPKLGVSLREKQLQILEAINKSRKCRKLLDSQGPKSEVAIAVTDSTRPTPNMEILSVLLHELRKSGVEHENVTIIIATGMHKPDSPEKIKRNVGWGIMERAAVVNHDPEDQTNLEKIGRSKLGTDIEVNKVFANANLKIATGSITPCMLAGWTGGGKIVMPGISSRRSIEQNHALFVRNLKEAGRGAMFGHAENNIVREDIDDVAQRSGLDFIVNTVQDEEGGILRVFAGDSIDAHKRGLSYAKKAMKVTIPRKGDIVIASPGVRPHEVSLYQSGSRVFGSIEGLVKKGGTVILVSSCFDGIYEGIEKDKFRNLLLSYHDPEKVLRLTEKKEIPSFEACVCYQFAYMKQRYRIVVVTDGMSEDEIAEIGMEYAPTVDEAIISSLKFHGSNAKVIAVPYASITYTEY